MLRLLYQSLVKALAQQCRIAAALFPPQRRRPATSNIAVYACDRLVTLLLAVGDPLSDVQREAENGLEFACKGKFGYIVDIIAGQLALIRTLRGQTSGLSSFNDAEFDEGRFERHLEGNPNLVFARCWYWIRKLQARYLAGDYVSAVAAASKAEPLVQMRLYAEIELRGSNTSSRAIGRPGVFESVGPFTTRSRGQPSAILRRKRNGHSIKKRSPLTRNN